MVIQGYKFLHLGALLSSTCSFHIVKRGKNEHGDGTQAHLKVVPLNLWFSLLSQYPEAVILASLKQQGDKHTV